MCLRTKAKIFVIFAKVLNDEQLLTITTMRMDPFTNLDALLIFRCSFFFYFTCFFSSTQKSVAPASLRNCDSVIYFQLYQGG